MRAISEDEREDARIQERELRMVEREPDVREVVEEVTLTHPASRAGHSINNALQILNLIVASTTANTQSLRMDASDARRLVEAAMPDIAALQQLLDRQERVLAELREEGVRMAQYIVRLEDAESRRVQEVAALREQVTTATRLAESLYEATNADVGLAAVRHSRVLRLRAALTTTVTDTPRLVAAGGK